MNILNTFLGLGFGQLAHVAKESKKQEVRDLITKICSQKNTSSKVEITCPKNIEPSVNEEVTK